MHSPEFFLSNVLLHVHTIMLPHTKEFILLVYWKKQIYWYGSDNCSYLFTFIHIYFISLHIQLVTRAVCQQSPALLTYGTSYKRSYCVWGYNCVTVASVQL